MKTKSLSPANVLVAADSQKALTIKDERPEASRLKQLQALANKGEGARSLQLLKDKVAEAAKLVRTGHLSHPSSPEVSTPVAQKVATEFQAGSYAAANATVVAGFGGEASVLDNWLIANAALVGAPAPGLIFIPALLGLTLDGVLMSGPRNYNKLRRDIAARVLNEQLTLSGLPPVLAEPDQTQTHHIVEFGSRRADLSRRILTWAGININSAVNGVHLPSAERDDGGGASVHRGSHSAAYSALVLNRLIHAVNLNRQVAHAPAALTNVTIGAYLGAAAPVAADVAAIVAALNVLRAELLAGQIKLNTNTDTDCAGDASDDEYLSDEEGMSDDEYLSDEEGMSDDEYLSDDEEAS